MTTLIIGASNKAHRFSYKAFRLLKQYGHEVVPMHPILKDIEGHAVVNTLSEIAAPIDTVTLYVSPDKSVSMAEDIIKLKPRRIIFNPGTENVELMQQLQSAGIVCLEACTLVLLDAGNY
jgi:uncharacterized protein